MSDNKRLILAYNSWATGTQPSGWRHPRALAHATADPAIFTRTAEITERGLFDYYFLGTQLYTRPRDPLALPKDIFRIDGPTLVSYLAARTNHIGLVPTYNASFSHPFTVARELASLDHLSGGRAGLHIITGRDPFAARNYGFDGPDERHTRYARITEFVRVLRLLWDSWEDGAMLLDKQSGRFIDPSRSHAIDHDGEFYQVSGPLNVPRPPQGQLPILHAGESDASQEFGCAHADARFTPLKPRPAARELYRRTKENVAAQGRDPDRYPVIAGVTIYTAETAESARALFREVQDLTTRPYDPVLVTEFLGIDDLAPQPDARINETLGRRFADSHEKLADVIDKFGTSELRFADLFNYLANNGRSVLVGSAQEIADRLEDGLGNEEFDGITFFPPFTIQPLESFVDLVVPLLQRKSIYKTAYEAKTLREGLGIGPARPSHID